MIRLARTLSRLQRESSATTLSTNLLTRAGYIESTGSGTVAWLALGTQVLRQVERVIREEMDALSDEVVLGTLQHAELWERSGRLSDFGAEMFRLQDRGGSRLVLGATAEEAFTRLAKRAAVSYRDLSLHGYQISTKYRDELRARGGLMRGKEFLMKDAYSLHLTEEDADESYEAYREAYRRIFERCGVTAQDVAAENGAMGGSRSHEFVAQCVDGDDELDGEKVAEVGHIFQLGEKYTRAFDLAVTCRDGERRHAQMNCYGIGISRLIGVMAAQNADEHGLRWGKEVAVADVHLLGTNETNRAAATELAARCEAAGRRVILDDRDVRAGVSLNDADLIGATKIVTVGRGWQDGEVEVKDRWSLERSAVRAEALLSVV